MSFATADLCDQHSGDVQIAAPGFHSFGQLRAFHGPIHPIKTFEDNTLVRAALKQLGAGKVLVVDGAASMRYALLGDNLAQLVIENQWAGVVINGCIRDSAIIDTMAVGVKALGTHPLKSQKRNYGEEGVPVTFAGVLFVPGQYLYADADGMIVSPKPLI